jgi:predicted lipoprotein with Yx(FWY)xxD motif
MTRFAMLLAAGALAVAGCGDDEAATSSAGAPEAAMEKDDAAMKKDGAAMKKDDTAMASARGTTITVRNSEFGRMLFDRNKQAIYIFENDRRNRTVCYGECAEAWPPVYTKGKPRAGKGVRQSLLGTVKRRDGRLQVTYAGKPLYFYDHEGPGEVRCHNVDLNGGFWWVLGPDGNRRP